MNTSDYLFLFLQKTGSLQISEFGRFFLQNIGAQLAADQKQILPPAKQIMFEDGVMQSDEEQLINFLVKEKNTSREGAQFDLKLITEDWKLKKNNSTPFSINNIGSFVLDPAGYIFKGERITKESPDFFGLEQIDLKELKTKKESTTLQHDHQKDYQFNKSILWVFLVIVPVAAMVYLGITQKEKIFGKESFKNLEIKNSTHRIEPAKKPNALPKSDTVHQVKSDSIIKIK